MTSGHEVSVAEQGSFTNAVCSCGWRGPARRSRRLARQDGDEHLEQSGASPAVHP